MPSFRDWLRATCEGRSFVTTGPLLFLEVDGQAPGEKLVKQGPQKLTARVRVRLLYRRFWPQVAEQRGWPANETVVSDQTVPVPRAVSPRRR